MCKASHPPLGSAVCYSDLDDMGYMIYTTYVRGKYVPKRASQKNKGILWRKS